MIFKQITINFCNIFTEALLKYPFSSKGKKGIEKNKGKSFYILVWEKRESIIAYMLQIHVDHFYYFHVDKMLF